MDTVPRDVIECAILDGQMPQYGDGAEWCEQHSSCYRCAKDIHDMMVEEIRRLKAERDRALAELDKALGEREDAMLSERNAAYNAGFDEGFASADDWLAQHEDAMAEHGWVKLPKDADGEYIRIGDVMEWPDGKTFEVVGIGDGVLFYAEDEDGPADWTGATTKRHHHVPTVEDVLEELLREYERDDSELTTGEIIERFAAKLRLAGDVE